MPTDLDAMDNTNLEIIRCTCSEDLCNSPSGMSGEVGYTPNSSATSIIIPTFLNEVCYISPVLTMTYFILNVRATQ